MHYFVTPDEMRQCDQFAINELGIPSALLMENAARSASDFLKTKLEIESSICFLCGPGNNGGDGFAMARHMVDNYYVEIFWIGKEEKMSPETATNFEILKKLNIPITHLDGEFNSDLSGFDCIVDSLLGVGGDENLRGIIPIITEYVNELDSVKIAVDVPTGLNSLNGEVDDNVFIADYTITMYSTKLGMMLNEGPDVCGEVYIASLGAPEAIIEETAVIYSLEDNDIEALIPYRNRISSKFDYGRVLIIAGSENMPGAACLSANAAIKSGSGLVYLFTPKSHSHILPEVISFTGESTVEGTLSDSNYNKICKVADKCNSLLIGPGLGISTETNHLIENIIDKYIESKTIIVDADGIKALNKERNYNKNLIITPHTGEFSSLVGRDRIDIERRHSFYVKEWAGILNCNVLLKYIPTVISDGEDTYLNLGGNPGMATAGSGDVLSGIIAALACVIGDQLLAATAGAYIHSKAGDHAAKDLGMTNISSSDILNYIGKALRELGIE